MLKRSHGSTKPANPITASDEKGQNVTKILHKDEWFIDFKIEPHCQNNLQGHSAGVFSLLLLPDGKILSASHDGTFKYWDIEKEICIKTLKRSFSPTLLSDGRIVGGSFDNTFEMFDAKFNFPINRFDGHIHHYVNYLFVLPDGRILSGSYKEIKLWDINTGNCIQTFSIDINMAKSFLMLSNNKILLGSHNIKILDIEKSLCINTLSGHSNWVRSLILVSDDRILSGSDDHTLKLWNIQKGICIKTLEGHNDAVSSLLLLPDQRVLSGSFDKTIKLWDIQKGACIKTLEGHTDIVYSLLLLPSGRVLSGSEDNSIKLWDLGLRRTLLATSITSETSRRDLLQTSSKIPSLTFTEDEKNLNDSEDISVIGEWLIDPNKDRCEKDFTGADGTTSLLLLPDRRVVSGSLYNNLKLWDIETGSCIKTFITGEKDSDTSASPLLLLHDGQILSGSGAGFREKSSGELKLWDIVQGTCIKAFVGHTNAVKSLLLLPNSQVLSGSCDKTIKLWDIQKGTCIKTLKGHNDSIESLLLLPDGRLVSGSADNTIKLWNIQSGQCLKTLEGHKSVVTSLLLLPDGRVLSGSWDKTMKLWDMQKSVCINTLYGHGAQIQYLFLLPNGPVLSVSNNNVIRIWDIQRGTCIKEVTGHNNAVFHRNLLLLTDGKILSQSYHQALQLWDIGLRRRLATVASTSPMHQPIKPLNQLSILQQPIKPTSPLPPPVQQTEQKIIPTPAINTTANWQISYEIPYDEIKFGKELGKGGFGVVYQGTWRFNNTAIKKLLNQNPSDDVLTEFKTESHIMARLRSPNIIQFYGCTLKPQYCIVMEYMHKGSLYNVLHSKEDLSSETRYKIIRDIACGIAFLHAENILHRDLKSLNVLLDEHYRAKLTDFGLAKLKTESQSTSTQSSAGTLAWMAPELFKRKATCTKQSDIYSAGITFWEIASRKVPFEDARGNPGLIQNWVTQGERDDIPEDCSPKVAKLIKWCWDQEPTKRPTAEQVVDYLTKEEPESENSSSALQSGPQYRSLN